MYGGLKNYPFSYFEESIKSHVYDKSFVEGRILECQKCKHTGLTMNEVLNDPVFVWNFLNINKTYFGKIKGLRSRDDVIYLNELDLSSFLQEDGSYVIMCENHHKITIRKSTDKFYIFWQPREGKFTGPNNNVIEVVDLYVLN